MRGMSKSLVFASLIVAIAPFALAQDRPDGKVTLSGGAIAAGIGYSWGNGTLDYQGKKYRFSIDGLSIVDVGASTIEGVGDVYNLKNPTQFAGNYVAAGVGATIAGGGSVVALENQNGVIIHLHTTQEGLRFNLSASGMSVRLN
jgi:hypothetical protein